MQHLVLLILLSSFFPFLFLSLLTNQYIGQVDPPSAVLKEFNFLTFVSFFFPDNYATTITLQVTLSLKVERRHLPMAPPIVVTKK